MKENYEFWFRIVEEMKSAVEKAENELLVNEFFLRNAKIKLKQFPKPKKDTENTNPIVQ